MYELDVTADQMVIMNVKGEPEITLTGFQAWVDF